MLRCVKIPKVFYFNGPVVTSHIYTDMDSLALSLFMDALMTPGELTNFIGFMIINKQVLEIYKPDRYVFVRVPFSFAYEVYYYSLPESIKSVGIISKFTSILDDVQDEFICDVGDFNITKTMSQLQL